VSFVGQGVYFDPDLNIDGKPAKARGYMSEILTEHAVSFIETVPDTQPFLVVMAQKAVHPEIYPNFVRSFPPAPRDAQQYHDAAIPHGPSWRAPLTGKPALQRPYDVSDPRSPVGGLPDSVVRDRLRMLSAIDRSIGELIATLERRGMRDNTVIVVTSDQGFFYGEFGLAQERRLAYEPSIHIPFIVRYPRLAKAGSHPGTLASNVDVAPTLLALGGVNAPATMQGRSLVPALGANATSIRNELLIEYYSDTEFPRVKGMGYKAIRTDRYKFIRYDELRGMDEVYDLVKDPHELNNLLPDRVPPGVLADLNARLDKLLSGR
jgi:arylsulfatase A-like enzyme